jgi:hypothetical protein
MPAPAAVTLFPALAERPTATTITVRELIHRVQTGRVRVPRFQRPLRWRQAQVVDLLDSIWRGYPIGSLLLWRRPAPAERVQVGGAHVDAPEVADAWWVVDGQQRTTALAAALLDLDHLGDQRWVVRFAPVTQAFQPGPVPDDKVGIEVPVAVLGDLRRLGRWLRESTLDEAAIARVEDVQQRLLDYTLPVYVVETEDEHALRGVFARLNSTGTRMRADEVFQALVGAPSARGRHALDLDALQAVVEAQGFGVPPRAEVLKAVLAMAGLDPTKRVESLPSMQDLLLPPQEDVGEALARAVAFLQGECAIPHFSLIPYPVVFVILARWFQLHPDVEAPIRALLARWVWRGAASGAHQRAEVSRMREQLRAIEPDDPLGSLDRLLAKVLRPPAGSWRLERFNLKSAKSRIEVLAMLAQGPKDELGPVRLGELLTSGRVAREVLRASDWKTLAADGQALAKSAANRALLGTTHTGVGVALRQWAWPAREAELASHLIDRTALEQLRQHRHDSFLRHRASLVSAAVETFVATRAQWDEPELRPLALYLDDDGGEG